MSSRYKVRVHGSGEWDGSTTGGTIVRHIGGSEPMQACSMDEVEARIRDGLASGKLTRGFVYQIFDTAMSAERPRSFAAGLDGQVVPCLLDQAEGFYAGFQRIRYSGETGCTLSSGI